MMSALSEEGLVSHFVFYRACFLEQHSVAEADLSKYFHAALVMSAL